MRTLLDQIVVFLEENVPSDWIVNFANYDGELTFELKHPRDNVNYLSFFVEQNHLGIAVLKEEDRDLLWDLSGFDFSFEMKDMNYVKQALLNYIDTGIIKLNNN
jgi:hypothetical protein